ncbi:hypothetical protein PHMEG_00039930, partial [Phytophthora megakarya]
EFLLDQLPRDIDLPSNNIVASSPLISPRCGTNANVNRKLSTPWISDLGGWSMTSISKTFNYIVSKTQENQQ